MSSPTLRSSSASVIEDLYRKIDETTQEVLTDSRSSMDTSLNEKEDEQEYKIKSSYWKLVSHANNKPGNSQPKLECISAVDSIVAVASSEKRSNLRIYGLDTEMHRMTHISSISLPDIKCLEWLYDPTDDQSENELRFLLTGHSNGIVNLIMVPLAPTCGVEHAQIIKQFDHKKQLLYYTGEMDSHTSISRPTSSLNQILQMQVTPKTWTRCNRNSMLSLYGEHLFMWDTSRSSRPLLCTRTGGTSCFDSNPSTDGILALSGRFGVSLCDLRQTQQQASLLFIPSQYNKESVAVSWCKSDPNYICSASIDSTVMVWDIRMLKPVACLKQDTPGINSVSWDKKESIFSSSDDGKLVHWNLNDINIDNIDRTSQPIICTTHDGHNTDVTISEIGTPIYASEEKIINMTSCTANESILTIDKQFLGLHSRMTEGRPRSSSSVTCVASEKSKNYVLTSTNANKYNQTNWSSNSSPTLINRSLYNNDVLQQST
ncbi:DEBR0S6_05116g1_1 [Brettanomyces bruxellensis]|uniref:DEBR0S6_05116g1_1 n=1 Tax=Dekkera bruxellensis TaxID=5007 RepID=A0A7D9H578_DEKBR|nr:DEBR0S6_05116g1_1 [Brettanomyces bruxellensis]